MVSLTKNLTKHNIQINEENNLLKKRNAICELSKH